MVLGRTCAAIESDPATDPRATTHDARAVCACPCALRAPRDRSAGGRLSVERTSDRPHGWHPSSSGQGSNRWPEGRLHTRGRVLVQRSRRRARGGAVWTLSSDRGRASAPAGSGSVQGRQRRVERACRSSGLGQRPARRAGDDRQAGCSITARTDGQKTHKELYAGACGPGSTSPSARAMASGLSAPGPRRSAGGRS